MVSGAACRISGISSTRRGSRAADAFCDMDRVIEVDVVGQLVDAIPVQRLVFGQALAHRRQHRRAGPELRMAGHARLVGGMPAKRAFSTEVWQ